MVFHSIFLGKKAIIITSSTRHKDLFSHSKKTLRKNVVWQRSRVRIPYKPEFFSGFLFATAKVATINAMIFLSKNVEGWENSCCCIMRFVETVFFL